MSQTPTRNPEGCQTVAGGRSVAQTPGKGREQVCTLEGCQRGRPRQKGNELLEGRTEARRSKLFQLIEPAVGENGLAVLPLQRLFGTSFLGQQRFLAPFQGAIAFLAFPGLRCAPTPGYFLATLRVGPGDPQRDRCAR